MTNNEIASKLQQRARELWSRHQNLYRAKAYRRAADELLRLDLPIETLFHERGRMALEEIPGIGRRLSKIISNYLETGDWPESN